jgi:hypothetical protein
MRHLLKDRGVGSTCTTCATGSEVNASKYRKIQHIFDYKTKPSSPPPGAAKRPSVRRTKSMRSEGSQLLRNRGVEQHLYHLPHRLRGKRYRMDQNGSEFQQKIDPSPVPERPSDLQSERRSQEIRGLAPTENPYCLAPSSGHPGSPSTSVSSVPSPRPSCEPASSDCSCSPRADTRLSHQDSYTAPAHG